MMIEQLEHEAARDRERQAVQNVRHWRSIWPIRLATEDRGGPVGVDAQYQGRLAQALKPPFATSKT